MMEGGDRVRGFNGLRKGRANSDASGLLRRILKSDTFGQQGPPKQHTIRPVDAQDMDGGPALRRFTFKLSTCPSEVSAPFIHARIEETHDHASAVIDACQVRAFVGIAAEAGPAKILKRSGATVLFRDQVIHLKSEFGQVFREMTIFAPEPRALANLAA